MSANIETAQSRQRRTHIWESDPHGHYPEPLWTSKRLFDVENFGARGALILDPCAGWGRIPHNAVAAGYNVIGVDIVDRRHERHFLNGFQFFCGDSLKNPPLVRLAWSAVLNPPFSEDLIQRFTERALAAGSGPGLEASQSSARPADDSRPFGY
jgi:hypothetical protein